MSADPTPDAQVRAGSRYRVRLTWVFGLVLLFMVVEAVAAFLTGSLALLSDAGHMATDAIGIGMALAAIVAADDARRHSHRTYGLYRAEILAALANAVLLFAVAGYVLFEAFRRLLGGETPDVLAGPMLVVAVAGLIVNLVSWRLLRVGARESLNVEGAFLEVLADLIGSIGVVTAALIIQITRWTYIDPLVGIAIGLFILPRAWRLGAKAVRILIQAAPPDIDMDSHRSAGVDPDRCRHPRPTRVDAHLRHGRRFGASDDRERRRPPPRPRHGPRPVARRLRDQPCHPPGRARIPPRVRRSEVVVAPVTTRLRCDVTDCSRDASYRSTGVPQRRPLADATEGATWDTNSSATR